MSGGLSREGRGLAAEAWPSGGAAVGRRDAAARRRGGCGTRERRWQRAGGGGESGPTAAVSRWLWSPALSSASGLLRARHLRRALWRNLISTGAWPRVPLWQSRPAMAMCPRSLWPCVP